MATENALIMQVIPYREFEMSFLAPGETQEIILQNALPIAPFTVIGLSVRVHESKICAGAAIEVIVRGVNPSPEDGRDFVLDRDLGSTPPIDSSLKPPALVELSSVIVNPQTPYLRVVIKATGPSHPGSVWAILSADLVMKSA